jgi:hypothetical protein
MPAGRDFRRISRDVIMLESFLFVLFSDGSSSRGAGMPPCAAISHRTARISLQSLL